jgi:hypothetical protein
VRSLMLRSLVVLGMSLLTCAAGGAKEPAASSEVTVCLRNTVVSTPGAIERAKLVAKNMFASIGVNIHWRAPGSEHGPGIDVEVLLTGEESRDDNSGPLAEAFPFAGKTGHITIRYDRVRNSAGMCRELEPTLLGHVLVHEITHVLQCLDRHTDTGIMKSHWSSEDYYDMRWKPLTFTSQDIDLIRLGMQVLNARSETPGELATQEQHGH